ncbi:DUF7284 family protein [Halorussus ruber]|uniref:DUF7284 family protein n=1 Tax=Halorussus ruber TaxID=1126238 RepID=UPI001092B2E3|nr:hypothetical protein [Halorussus ruber]
MRAISTVLDASLCLLLVSASAMTLAGTPARDAETGVGPDSATGPDSADETAELVATSTARVTYEEDHEATKTIHDTLAGLLASALRADARQDARTNATDFTRAVADEVTATLRRYTSPDLGVQVVASEARVGSSDRISAGSEPPPEIDVHAARFALRETRFTVRTWSA